MKRFRFALLSIVSFFLLLSVLTPVTLAQTNFREGQLVVLEKDDVVNENYFAGGDNVRILGTVNGDVYAGGGNLTIEGTVNGDVLAAGGILNISGVVNGNVRVAGGQININGKIAKNVTVAGGQISVNEGAELLGSFTAAGGNLEVRSPIPGGVQVAGGNLYINSKVGGNIVFAGGNLNFGPEAKVAGDVNYYSEQEALVSEGATVSGKLKQNMPPQRVEEARVKSKNLGSGFIGFWHILSFISALLVGLLLTKLAPNFSTAVSEKIGSRFLPSLGLGFVVLIVAPIAAVILMVTLVGFPLGILLFVMMGFSFYFAKIFVALFIGKFITTRLTKSKSIYLDLLAGLLVFSLVGLIPVLGWVVQFVFVLASVGALLMQKRDTYRTLSEKKIV